MVLANMDDFPPNPVDGELWLPSYIIREISTETTSKTKSTPQNNVVFAPHLRRYNNPQDSKSNLVEICFGSFGTNNEAVPAVNNNKNKLAPPAPVISFHKPVTLTPTTTIIQGFEGRKSKAVVGTGTGTGTGVFLPRLMNVLAKKPEEISEGTGVFLNHQVAVTCQRKKTSEKEEEALGMNKTKKC